MTSYPNQYERYEERGGYVAGRESVVSSRITLDDYNSDLNFVIGPDGVTGSSLHKDGFEYLWAGARATHGVWKGKVRYNHVVTICIKPNTRDQVLLHNFSLTRSLAQKLLMPALEKGDLSWKTCRFVSYTQAN